MHRYVIERDLPGIGNVSTEALRQAARSCIRATTDLGPGIQWVRSHVTDNRIYCEFVAESEELVREHAMRAGLPANRVSEVREVLDPLHGCLVSVASVYVPRDTGRRLSPTQWMVVAIAAGVALGCLLPDRAGATGFRASDLAVVSTLFLRMIKSLIAPLVFSTLVVGIASHGDDLKGVGKLAVRSLLYFEVVTTLALVLGLVTAHVIRPGVGVRLGGSPRRGSCRPPRAHRSRRAGHIVPESIVDAAARNDALQIVIFAVVFAIGLSRVRGDAKRSCSPLREPLAKRCSSSPASSCASRRSASVRRSPRRWEERARRARPLGLLVLTLYGALSSSRSWCCCRSRSPRGAASAVRRAVKEPWLLAFTTASSEAALPSR